MNKTSSRSDPTTILIYGDIGDCGHSDHVTARQVIDQLGEAGGDVIVRISSGGGLVMEGIAIANSLRNYSKGRVTVYVDSIAASIASYIAIAGDELVMYSDSELMVHLPWDIVQGEAEDLRKSADQLDRFRDTLITGYSKKTGLDRNKLKSMLEATSWINAQEALELGFADRIEESELTVSKTMAAKIQNKQAVTRISAALDKLNSQTKEETNMAKLNVKNEEVIVETEVIEEELEAVEEAVEEVLEAVEAGEEVEADDVLAILEAVEKVGESVEFAKELISQNLSLKQAQARIIDRIAMKNQTVNRRSSASAKATVNVGVSHSEKIAKGMKNALLERAGNHSGIDFKNEFRSYTLVDMARACLEDSGVNTRMMSRDEIVTHAMTMKNNKTTDFPLLLQSVASDSVIKGYEDEEDTFSQWTLERSNRDFRGYAHAGLGNFKKLTKMAEDATYNKITLKEFGEELELETFGDVFRISRRAIINDQSDAFSQVPYLLGAATKSTIADEVYAALSSNTNLSDGNPTFHASRGNLITGAGSDLTADNLALAALKLRTMKDSTGARASSTPAFLIVPSAKRKEAMELVGDQYVIAGNGILKENPVRNLAVVVDDPRLDEISTTAWYLVGSPHRGGGMAVVYLDGQKLPHVAQEGQWDSDAIEHKVRIDVKAGVVNPLTLIKGAGTPPTPAP